MVETHSTKLAHVYGRENVFYPFMVYFYIFDNTPDHCDEIV